MKKIRFSFSFSCCVYSSITCHVTCGAKHEWGSRRLVGVLIWVVFAGHANRKAVTFHLLWRALWYFWSVLSNDCSLLTGYVAPISAQYPKGPEWMVIFHRVFRLSYETKGRLLLLWEGCQCVTGFTVLTFFVFGLNNTWCQWLTLLAAVHLVVRHHELFELAQQLHRLLSDDE